MNGRAKIKPKNFANTLNVDNVSDFTMYSCRFSCSVSSIVDRFNVSYDESFHVDQFICQYDFQLLDKICLVFSGYDEILEKYLIAWKLKMCTEMTWCNQSLMQFIQFHWFNIR